MDVTFRMDGEAATQMRLLRVGDAVRNNVQAAMLGLVNRGVANARSLAPRASRSYNTRAYKKYGAGRLASGINGYVQGNDLDFGAGQVGLSKRALTKIQPMLRDEGDVVGLILSQWYTGAFYERGFPERMITVNNRPYAKAYGAYNRSLARSIAKAKKERGSMGAVGGGDVGKARKAFERAFTKERAATYERKHRVRRQPFMAPTRDLIEREYKTVFQSAIDSALRAS